ncbi:MAG: prepilin-type N-terminal cleavage/methylation domain-containing protein [Candidatus Shapirobacteria bacterium]|jgi:prepilin-type N-terminal cleavage/methylation domain-containing protein
MKKTGFTLIEMIVVVASTGLIMTAITGITLGIFKSQNRNKSTNKVVQNGNWIMNELKKNVLNSSGTQINCINNVSIGMTNLDDNGSTVFSCGNNNIASTSGSLVRSLTNNQVNVTDCTNFVSCTESPALGVTSVKFNFGVGTTTAGVSVSQNFSLDVSVRN